MINWPDGKRFAFTVFDDTDLSILSNVKEIYSFLENRGFRTTKSVWSVSGAETPEIGGSTCEDRKYLSWVSQLQDAGFEIALHNVTYHSASRDETIAGIERFFKLFGHYPKTLANHAGCKESIYWGSCRLTGFNKFIYNLLTKNRHNGLFQGHIEDSEYFWGDICKDKIQYVRNFVYQDINTLKACPIMPYYDPQRPFVNYWFSSSEGPDIIKFNECISEKNQDRLEEEGGACIMYTHFASGFQKGNVINPEFRYLMERLSQKNGWFVPVSTLLDYLLEVKGHHSITNRERNKLERKWLLHKLKVGTS